jgi:hypothetical protein
MVPSVGGPGGPAGAASSTPALVTARSLDHGRGLGLTARCAGDDHRHPLNELGGGGVPVVAIDRAVQGITVDITKDNLQDPASQDAFSKASC